MDNRHHTNADKDKEMRIKRIQTTEGKLESWKDADVWVVRWDSHSETFPCNQWTQTQAIEFFQRIFEIEYM